jgi:YihY family inner membrane protein
MMKTLPLQSRPMSRLETFTRRAAPVMRLWLVQKCRIFWRALVKYDETDGEQRAASFAYYAFFAMFPLIVLFITLGTSFLKTPEAQNELRDRIVNYISSYIPQSQDSTVVIKTISGVVKSRKSASLIALAILAWSAMRFFQALVRGVNRAWGTKEYSWWRLPIKNLFMTLILASALLLGVVAPSVLDAVYYLYWKHSREVGLEFKFVWYVYYWAKLVVPILVLFYGFAMFYKFAPQRRTLFREVWTAALFVTISLQILQRLFVLYTTNITQFNALYGTFGSVVAMLLWIYLSGSIIILGGCLSAAKYEIEMSLSDQATSNHAR